MQRENKWQGMEERYKVWLSNRDDDFDINLWDFRCLQDFIQSEIDTARAEERGRVIEVLKNWKKAHTFNALIPQMKANEPYLKWLEEIINLIK